MCSPSGGRDGCYLWRRSRGIANHQFGADAVFLALRTHGAGEFMQSVGGQAAECLAMNVHGSDRRVAVLSQSVLSNPVTEISWGTRQPAASKPLMTPTAVKSFTAMTAVGRGDSFAMAAPAANPPSNRKSPGRIGPGSKPKTAHRILVGLQTFDV